MRSCRKTLLFLVIAALAAVFVSGCGDKEEKVAELDPVKVLSDTFGDSAKLKSGLLDAQVKIVNASTGGGAPAQDVSMSVSGPFQVTGEKSIPQFELKMSTQGAGPINVNVGAVSTGKKMYMTMNGKSYELPQKMLGELASSFEKSQSKGGSASALSALGIDPKEWLLDPKIVGEERFRGEDVIKVTTSIDKTKIFRQLKKAMSNMQALNPTAGTSTADMKKASDKAMRQMSKAFKSAAVELYTGKKDRIIRRLVLDLQLNSVAGLLPKGGAVKIDVNFSDVNKKQKISAPANAKPLAEMMQDSAKMMEGLAGSATTKGSSNAAGAATAGVSPEELQKMQKALKTYTDCMQKAGTDGPAVQKCSEALIKARS